MPLPAGGVTLHHCQTLHYSAPNKTNRQPRAFAIHFMTLGTRSLRDMKCLRGGASTKKTTGLTLLPVTHYSA